MDKTETSFRDAFSVIEDGNIILQKYIFLNLALLLSSQVTVIFVQSEIFCSWSRQNGPKFHNSSMKLGFNWVTDKESSSILIYFGQAKGIYYLYTKRMFA